jgi:uncharacterized protein YyaL (SSP411 family)
VPRGSPAELAVWQAQIRRHYLPRFSVLAIPADAADLPPALALRAPRGAIVAYVCRGSTCSPPATTLRELWSELQLLPEG